VLSGEKAFKIPAYLVRKIFRYFELHFRVGETHLNNAG